MSDDTKLIKKLNNKISALQGIINAYRCVDAARVKRQAGCAYCHDGKAIAINYINDSVIISRTKGGAYFLGTDKFDFEINNCPMCGRELREDVK